MPDRVTAIVVCSCGLRICNFIRAAGSEELMAAEVVRLENEVPRMIRHWRLGHTLTVNEKAPLWAKALIAKAARELADDEAQPRRREIGETTGS